MKTILTILVLLLALGPAAHAQRDLSQEQVAAYVILVKADRARDRNAPADALGGYRQAYQAFQAIAQKDPRWQPEVVKYRLAYCENEIDKLNRQAGGAPATPADASPTRDLVSQATTDLSAPALKPATEPDPAVQAELTQLRQDRQAWQGEKQTLLVQLEQLQAATSSLAAAEAVAAQVQALEEQNAQLRADLAKLETVAADAKENKGKARALKKLEEELAVALSKKEGLEADLETAREKAGADQTELAQKLETAQAGLSTLQEQNERLQTDLTSAQELAESRERKRADSARQLEEAQKRVSELTSAHEQAVAALPAASETDRAKELEASEQARQALEQQIAALTEEVKSLKAATPAQPAVAGDAPLQHHILELGEKLAAAGRQLDASREAALKLLGGGDSAR